MTETALFWRGFLAMLPLWSGAIPSGVAFGVLARASGLSPFETQLMSVVVFSSAAQLSVVALVGAGEPLPLLVATVMALNAQLPLLGLTVQRLMRPSWPKRLLAAFLLTDGAFGVAAARGPLRLPVLLGTGTCMFLGWNIGTALGVAAGELVPDVRRLGVDFVATLAFLAVLVPLLRTRTSLVVAAAAGVTTLALTRVLPVGAAVLGAGLVGCAVGAWWSRRTTTATSATA